MNKWMINKFFNRTKYLVTGFDKNDKKNVANFNEESDYYKFLNDLRTEKADTMVIKVKSTLLNDKFEGHQKIKVETIVDLDGNYYKDSYEVYVLQGIGGLLFNRIKSLFGLGIHFDVAKFLLLHTEEELNDFKITITYNNKIEEVTIGSDKKLSALNCLKSVKSKQVNIRTTEGKMYV